MSCFPFSFFCFYLQKGRVGVFPDPHLPTRPHAQRSSPRANDLKELKHKGMCGLVFMLPKESKELEINQAIPERIHLSGLTQIF